MNDELIDRVLARIEADPAGWNQADFFAPIKSDGKFCGTTACFAGHALLASGWTIELGGSDSRFEHRVIVRDPQGVPDWRYDDRAAELLGFDKREVYEVFYNTQTDSVAELREVIEGIRARRAKVN